MITESPPHGTANCSAATRITVDFEVPDAGRGADDKLGKPHDEGIDPEEHENLVEGNIASIFIPLHLRDEFIARARCRCSDREDKDGADNPNTEPDHAEDVGQEGQDEDPQV